MGQAFRRAAGRVRSSGLDTTSSSSSSLQSANRRPTTPPPGPVDKVDIYQRPTDSAEGASSNASRGVVEERDPVFNSMLSQMAGRITTKRGGKSETGEAFMVEKYNRPLPKVRNTTVGSGRYEDRAAPPGTLNVAQLQQMMLLYHGKADGHRGPMNVKQLAERFRLDASQVQKILQYVSLPPEDTNTRQKNDRY